MWGWMLPSALDRWDQPFLPAKKFLDWFPSSECRFVPPQHPTSVFVNALVEDYIFMVSRFSQILIKTIVHFALSFHHLIFCHMFTQQLNTHEIYCMSNFLCKLHPQLRAVW
jgi:hypothetical protein